MKSVKMIGDVDLSIHDVLEVAHGAEVRLSESARLRIQASRDAVERISQEQPVYGFSRGFGQHQAISVPPKSQRLLQRNLIMSHALSFGEPASPELVRATMVLRVNALAVGHSGVRVELVEKLIEVLNHPRISPYMPLIGSLGASGDLSSMSHIGLTLIGEGRTYLRRQEEAPVTQDVSSAQHQAVVRAEEWDKEWDLVSSAEALKACGIEPIELESKEGLAINNGMQCSAAQLLLIARDLERHVKLATRLTGCLTEAMFGLHEAFLPQLHRVRPYPGQGQVAALLLDVFTDSQIRAAHPPHLDPNVQDPYSSRCLPQIIGPFFDALEQTYRYLKIEMNSATDNPLVFGDQVISGGNFHGMPLALAAANLFNAYCAVVKVIQAQLARLVDSAKNRLGVSCLIDPRSDATVSSGMMIAEYSAHALGQLILSRNSLTFLHSVSSASGQEDHVSHAPTVLYNLQSTLPHFEQLLAILACLTTRTYELLATPEMRARCVERGQISPDATLTPGKVGRRLLELVQPHFTLDKMVQDGYFRDQLERVARELIHTHRLAEHLDTEETPHSPTF